MKRYLAVVLLLLSTLPVYAAGVTSGSNLHIESDANFNVYGDGLLVSSAPQGSYIYILGGPGWNPGRYQIQGEAANYPPTGADTFVLNYFAAGLGASGGVWSLTDPAPKSGSGLTVQSDDQFNVYGDNLFVSSLPVGSVIYITGGSGWYPGRYTVTAEGEFFGPQYRTTFRLDRYAGNAGASGGQWQLSAPSTFPTLTIHPTYTGKMAMALVGDSITAHLGSTLLTTAQTAYPHASSVVVDNLGVSGSETSDWLPGTNNFTGAVSTMNGSHTSVANISLGTNDAAFFVPATTYAANLTQIVSALYSQVPTLKRVVLQVPPYIASLTFGDNGDHNPLLQAYTVAAATVPRTVQGTGQTFSFFQQNPYLLSDGVHPTDLGNTYLMDFWLNSDDNSVEYAGGALPADPTIYVGSDTSASDYVVRLVRSHGIALLFIPFGIYGLYVIWQWVRKAFH